VLSPALLLVGWSIYDPNLWHLYQKIPHVVLLWAPVFCLLWAFALMRLFWPERLPGRLAADSRHRKIVLQLGRASFWVASICFTACIAALCTQHNSKSQLINLLGKAALVGLSAGITTQEYLKLRQAPAATIEKPSRGFTLLMLPVATILVGMMVIASRSIGWAVSTGALFSLLLFIVWKLWKQELSHPS